MSQQDQTLSESERTLLATLMLRPGDCHNVTVSPEHFLVEQHADLYEAIRQMHGDSQPVDPVSMADHFERIKRKSMANLAMAIGNDAFVTTAPHVFAHRIKSAWRQRQGREIGKQLIESTDDGDLDSAVQKLMALHATEHSHEWSAKQASADAFQELNRIHGFKGKLPGITTGLRSIDDKLGGLHDSDLTIIAARAAMGKTAFLIGMAIAAAQSGAPVGFISGEQPVRQVAMRMLSHGTGIEAKKFRTAQFTSDEWGQIYEGVANMGALPMSFLDRSSPRMAEVARVARRWKHVHGIRALYVDYLQRLQGEGDRRHEQVGNVARALKNLARDLNIPVIALAQVSRAVEGKSSPIPRLGDLSDSSEIEKEADQVVMLYRPSYYNASEPKDIAKAIIEKNRHGPTGFIDVSWNGSIMRFLDLDDYNHSMAL